MFEYPTNLDPGPGPPPRRHPHLSSSWSQPWARAASVWMTKVCPSKVPLQLSPTQKIFPEASQHILISGNIIFRHGKLYIKKGQQLMTPTHLDIYVFEEFHFNFMWLHLCSSNSLEIQFAFLHLDDGILNVCQTNWKNNVLRSLSPHTTWMRKPAAKIWF